MRKWCLLFREGRNKVLDEGQEARDGQVASSVAPSISKQCRPCTKWLSLVAPHQDGFSPPVCGVSERKMTSCRPG
jgi:hypothetical protein